MDAISDTRKKIGYALFIVGLVLIAYVVGSIILLFVGFVDVPIDVFKTDESDEESENSLDNISKYMDTSMKDMYPMYNLSIWLSIAFILLFAGYFLCKLGLAVITPQTSPKSFLRKTTEKKNYHTDNKDSIQRGTYYPVDEEKFENRPNNPI
jgi:nucleoside recognition membrane protein YjiH